MPVVVPTMQAPEGSGVPTKHLAPEAATPRVTAGLMCPPDLYDASTPAKTAMPHPQLTCRKPVPAPLLLGRTLLATTPPPMSSRIAEPTTSERKIVPVSYTHLTLP